MLRATVELGHPGALYGRPRGQLTAEGVLAVAVLAEARGATVEQVGGTIPKEWKQNIRILHDFRAVTVVPEEPSTDAQKGVASGQD